MIVDNDRSTLNLRVRHYQIVDLVWDGWCDAPYNYQSIDRQLSTINYQLSTIYDRKRKK
ncbi:MAG: hypothetical protein ACRC62_02735 [Microcoleus sp.]